MSDIDITRLARRRSPHRADILVSEVGLTLTRDREQLPWGGQPDEMSSRHYGRLTLTLDTEPLSSIVLSAADLRALAARCVGLARELDRENEASR